MIGAKGQGFTFLRRNYRNVTVQLDDEELHIEVCGAFGCFHTCLSPAFLLNTGTLSLPVIAANCHCELPTVNPSRSILCQNAQHKLISTTSRSLQARERNERTVRCYAIRAAHDI